jgi:hypothetical protein
MIEPNFQRAYTRRLFHAVITRAAAAEQLGGRDDVNGNMGGGAMRGAAPP